MIKHGWLSGGVLTLGLMAGEAEAQSAARSFDDLRDDVKSGDIVLVALQEGEIVWGQVEELSTASLSLFTAERVGAGASFPKTSRRVLPESSIIEIRRSDAASGRGAQLFYRPARSFADLSRVLKAGDRITITEADGRVSRGVVAAASPTALTLRGSAGGLRLARPGDPPPAPRSFQADRVVSVARGGDSPWTGAAIGAAVGVGLAAASVASAAPQNASDAVVLFGPLPALGAGIGFLADWATGRPKLLWSAESRARTEIRPILGRGAKGVALSLRF